MNAWRSYTVQAMAATPSPTFNISLVDSDGFTLLQHSITVHEFTQTVGPDGLLTELQAQVRLPASVAIVKQIKGWEIGWSTNWPEWTAPPETKKGPGT